MSAGDPFRRPIEQLGARLRTLHGALVEIARACYEREHGPFGSPQLLHLLLHDASFAWLRALSMLMADVDSLLDRPSSIEAEDAAAVRLELDRLLTGSPPFSTEYAQYL